jgi:predicted TIM-barrel fold metal-dependent hydrolase
MTDNQTSRFIDVHQHLVPDVFRDLLKGVGINGGAGEELAPWDVTTTLSAMDTFNIAASVLSYTISGIDITDAAFFRKLARESNEYLGRLVADHPDRFGGFALLPLPDIDGTLDEIAYALDVLKLDGVGMHSNMGGVYPGDPRLAPVFEELNRRHAVIHLHPTDIPEGRNGRPGWLPYIVEFPFETVRAAADLVYSGTMERYPNVSIILSHAGGAVPYVSWRLFTGEFTVPGFHDRSPAGVFSYLKRFYYDTAMASHGSVFASLMEVADPSRIVFGTDYPYMPEMAIGLYVSEIEKYEGFDQDTLKDIEHNNALRLFPRLGPTKREP